MKEEGRRKKEEGRGGGGESGRVGEWKNDQLPTINDRLSIDRELPTLAL
ncbi:MAG: hypothetical protein ACRC62_04650 [Microcoleus sp.]